MLISFHTELFTLAEPSIVSQKEHCQNLCPESLPLISFYIPGQILNGHRML